VQELAHLGRWEGCAGLLLEARELERLALVRRYQVEPAECQQVLGLGVEGDEPPCIAGELGDYRDKPVVQEALGVVREDDRVARLDGLPGQAASARRIHRVGRRERLAVEAAKL